LQLPGVATDDVMPAAVVDRATKGYLQLGHLSEILTAGPSHYWERSFDEPEWVRP
jgi:hypothetical protein